MSKLLSFFRSILPFPSETVFEYAPSKMCLMLLQIDGLGLERNIALTSQPCTVNTSVLPSSGKDVSKLLLISFLSPKKDKNRAFMPTRFLPSNSCISSRQQAAAGEAAPRDLPPGGPGSPTACDGSQQPILLPCHARTMAGKTYHDKICGSSPQATTACLCAVCSSPLPSFLVGIMACSTRTAIR